MRQISEYTPSARQLVSCLTSEYQWLNLLKNRGKDYEHILDYLITLGEETRNESDYDSKKYQSNVISMNTGTPASKIKKYLTNAYNDILELNSAEPELFRNGGKYLYCLWFSNRLRDHYCYFNLWLTVPLNIFDSFSFHFIYAKVNESHFWVEA